MTIENLSSDLQILNEVNIIVMNTLSPLVSAVEAIALFSRPHVVVVDARGGADAHQRYERAHVSGSIFFDLETDLSEKGDPAKGGRHPLPDPSAFGRALGQAGITPESHLLVYDDKAGANAAARFWWMMKSLGHQNIQVIDGGLASLQDAGVTSSKRLPATTLRAPYPAKQWLWPRADMQAVNQARQSPDWLVIDVRENFRFRGESEPIDLVAGHIPGAVNVPYLNNLEPNGTFRSRQALAEVYKRVIGNRDSRSVIVHCGSGVTACHSIFAMASAGLPIPALYVGSWSEWSRNEKPMSTSDAS